MTERDLARAYGMNARVGPLRRTEPCACGADITAEVGWEQDAVDSHNATALHQAWRRWKEAQEARK